mmetsp:Transcript_14076/g.26302  ORF Transcript_14076/g.26302 Transcript_14076/m.26302 type:complete len:116 (-) Transcript_14076:72-419(-)
MNHTARHVLPQLFCQTPQTSGLLVAMMVLTAMLQHCNEQRVHPCDWRRLVKRKQLDPLHMAVENACTLPHMLEQTSAFHKLHVCMDVMYVDACSTARLLPLHRKGPTVWCKHELG